MRVGNRIVVACSALALAGCVPIAGMMPMPPNFGGVGGTGMSQAEIDNARAGLAASQAAGAASAKHPGDEALTCDQLQAEMTAMMMDPKVKATMQAMGANAQAQQDKITRGIAAGNSNNFTAADARSPLQNASDMAAIMPQMMRGQRINELAAARNCAFLKSVPH